ncbi:MAG: CBS domain-containing protein [Chloroflexi bacterium]|nr:CBS domain-containing protein [Chloroflexota bacterium]
MSEREQHRLAKRTTVAEIDHHLDIGPNIVRADEDLLSVARRAIAQPHTRLLAVVDTDQRIVGVIPVLRVVEEIVAHVSPESLMAEVKDLASAGRFGREVGARVAGDLMSAPVTLRPDSTVGNAFRAMHEHRYSGLPVVDDERHVIGYIDLLELALRYLEDFPELARSVTDPPIPDQPVD